MRIKSLVVVFLLSLVLVGCNFDEDFNRTPEIGFTTFPRLQNGDSLMLSITNKPNVFSMDTISVGDTVSFLVYMLGFNNNLTDFYLTQSEDNSATVILPNTKALDSIFSSRSEYDKGKFFVNPGYNNLYFPFKYVATKANDETKLTVRVVSDAKFKNISFDASFSTFELITPIK